MTKRTVRRGMQEGLWKQRSSEGDEDTGGRLRS